MISAVYGVQTFPEYCLHAQRICWWLAEDSSQKGTGSKRCELQSCLILFASCVTLSIQLFTALPHWWQVGPTWLPAVGVLPIAPNRTEERTRSVKVLRQFCNSQRLLPVPFWLESSACAVIWRKLLSTGMYQVNTISSFPPLYNCGLRCQAGVGRAIDSTTEK